MPPRPPTPDARVPVVARGTRALDAARTVLAALVLVGGLPGAPPPAAAQEAPGDAPGGEGELHERLVSAADSTQSYALFLPPGWDGSEPRPLLVVMDPRGRAVSALERFREPARRHGWLVVSSYNTLSDTDRPEVNERAIDAILADAQRHMSVDTDRIYLAGFSGTARLGWVFADALSPHVAGLVAVGAGFPEAFAVSLSAGAARLPDHFAVWGGSGRLDFNHEEVRSLDRLLDRIGVRHRVVHHEGGHGWLPAEVAAEAVAWLEALAMRHGLAPVDTAFVDSLAGSWSRRARAAEAAGDTLEALETWRALARDLDGLAPVDGARGRAEALAASDAVRRHRRRRDAQRAEHEAFGRRFWPLVERMRTGDDPPSPDEVARELEMDDLRARRRGDDPADARHAGRLLELIYVQTSFYVPRAALRAGEPGRALAALEVAERAAPRRPRTCWFRARAHALAGRTDAAFEALRCARRRGPLPRGLLEDDPWLEPLRGDPRWPEAVGGPAKEPPRGAVPVEPRGVLVAPDAPRGVDTGVGRDHGRPTALVTQ